MLIFLLSTCLLQAQTVVVDAALEKGVKDSVRKAATMLAGELAKAGYANTAVREAASPADQAIFLTRQKTGSAKLVGPEIFSIQSDGKKTVIGANYALGIEQGVIEYLYQLGFRYYFPHPAWYVYPQKPALFKTLNLAAGPSFDHRRIWYAYGSGSPLAEENYRFWFMANHQGGSMDAVVGHAYDDIIARNQQIFLKHPEWLYPVNKTNTIPPDPKFDLANKELVDFVIQDVLSRLEKAQKNNTPIKTITLAPSDGIGTCNTPACQELGTITDRVYSLINKAARVVAQKYPGTWVSGMAYSEYSAPPTRSLEPNVFVSIATAYNYTKFSTDDLIAQWSKKAGKVGMYDYLGLYAWDFDLPGKGLAARPAMAVDLVKKYHRLGARTYDAESTPGSINKGLGHYLVARLLWDANADTDGLRKEFFRNCFGKAATLLSNLWAEWESYPYEVMRESDLASWIDITDEAARLDKDPRVAERLSHIKSYLHYLYLYMQYNKTKAEPELIALLNYCYNTSDIGSFSGYPALFVIASSSGKEGYWYNDPKAKYKSTNPSLVKAETIQQLVSNDRKTLVVKEKIRETTLPATFKKASVPPLVKDPKYYNYRYTTIFTGSHYFVFQVNEPGEKNYLSLSAGYVAGGGSERPVSVSVYPYKGVIETSGQPLVQYDYTSRKMDTQRVSLGKLAKGTYLMLIADPQKMFKAAFSPSVLYAGIMNSQNRLNAYTRYMSFYVPPGTKKFRVFKDIETILVAPNGRVVDFSKKGTEELDVDVKPGEEGLWLIHFLSGRIHIEGIPPFICMEPDQMLIPR